MEKLSRLLSSGLSAARSLAVAVLFVVAAAVSAQTVSISPKTGNVISAVSYNDENHVQYYGGVWVHDQLPLTLLTSDDAELTDDGLVKKHANNVGVEEGKGKLGLISGHGTIKNHMTLSLPKGYRFTSYKIVLNYETWHENNNAVATTFRETKRDFATDYALVKVKKDAKKVTLTRTSLSGDDMGNILYFLQDHENGHSTVSVESFTITFECTDKFGEILRPDISKPHSPVACIGLPFKTERVDLGTITRQSVNGYTSYKYDYNSVKDLQADFLFYDESGIVGGTAVPGTVGNSTIQDLVNTGERTFLGLKNGTYWLEVPTDAIAQDGKTRIPVGYRIVGARVVYTNSLDPEIKPGDDIYITDGKGRYMNANLNFTPDKVAWKYGTDKKVSTTSGKSTMYLKHNSSWWSVSLSTTTNARQATAYETDGLNLYYGSNSRSYVISCDDDGNATYNVANSYAVVAKVNHGVSNTSFTIKLYDKTDKYVAHEATVNAGHPSGDLVLERINNDAIKLQVEGLEGDNLAYVCLEVQLEALNPYIDKMDIVCTQGAGEKQIKNHYLADDFTIGTNGKVDFSVPTNFGTENLRFTFEGLHSKNADETYGPLGTQGEYSRYHFVQSAYYNLIDENLQDHRADAADHPYADKLVVRVAGNKAFTCNNSDNFKAGMSGDGTFVYEENRYSNDKYNAQGGQWQEITVNSGNVDHYLIVCDETRYNIAPTTTPRHAYYACYSTRMRLIRENYEPVITYERLYDNAMLENGFDNNFYAGVKVTLKDMGGNALPEGTGYVYAKQVIDKMKETADGKPVDLRHVLYVDLSNVNTVIMSENDAAIGKLSDIKALVGMNALIYLPQGVTASLDNVATKSEAGDDFNAENNIVLTDKLPFYSPYDIRVNANNEVVYKRTIIKDNNTNKWVSVVMPFTLALDPGTGTYSQPADGGEFTFYTMKADNSFSSTGKRYEVNGHFTPCSEVSKTEANKPYLVNIEKYPDSATDDNVMFTLRQRGTTIVKTPSLSSLEGETAQGTVDGSAMSLTNRGTYSGEMIAKTKGVFYFNKDLFVSSLNLDERYPDVCVFPFRTWYDCEGSANRAVRYIRISTEPNTNTTNISQVAVDAVDAGFDCSANSGMLTVKATKDVRVSVRAISGKTLGVAMLRAGDSRTFSLPNGIYVVNGTKVMVR